MVRLRLSSPIDQVMGSEGLDISHYLNTIKTIANLCNFGIGMIFFVANERFVNLELYIYFCCWNLELVSLKFEVCHLFMHW